MLFGWGNRGARIWCTPRRGVHGSGAPLGQGCTDLVLDWCTPNVLFLSNTENRFFFCSGQDCCEKFKGVEIYWGGDPQQKQSAVGFRESYSFQIVRNIIYNACALLIESSIASCSFVFSIACVDGLLTVSVLDHNKVQTCIWSDTASSVWRYAATSYQTQIINYLWVH